MKKFLAFDAAGEELIAGCCNGKKYYEKRQVGGGTERLLPLIDEVLNQADMKISDVEVVCVGVGPGSWTGSRVSVVTAYGFHAGNPNIKFCPFNSFDLISYNGNENKKIVKLVGAYANFVYVNESENIVAETKDVLEKKYEGAIFISASEVVSGVKLCKRDLQSLAYRLVEGENFVDINKIEPMYLRKSQAEYNREGKYGV